MLPFFSRLTKHSSHSPALTYRLSGVLQKVTYEELLLRSQSSGIRVLEATDRHKPIQLPTVVSSPQNQCLSIGRIPLLDIGTDNFVTSLLGTWMAGFASVPLCEF